MLDIHRRPDFNSGIKQELNVFPALAPRRAGDIGMRQFVYQGDARHASKHGLGVHVFERTLSVLDFAMRLYLEALSMGDRVRPSMGLKIGNDYIETASRGCVGILEHLKRLANAGRIS